MKIGLSASLVKNMQGCPTRNGAMALLVSRLMRVGFYPELVTCREITNKVCGGQVTAVMSEGIITHSIEI